MRSKRLLLPFVAVFALLMVAEPGPAAPPHIYVGGLTPVVRDPNLPGGTVVDEGTMMCQPSKSRGVGGACIKFGAPFTPAFIEVNDVDAGLRVAFQVCIDSNGDSVCGTPLPGNPPPCAGGDKIIFSHSDTGAFFNPLGPLPTSQPPCPGHKGWKGYVVLLCEGVHGAPTAHSHPALLGTVQRTTTGSAGTGNFCGAPQNIPGKAYQVIPCREADLPGPARVRPAPAARLGRPDTVGA